MNNYNLYGFMFIEILFSLFLLQIMILLFIQTNNIILKLEKNSENTIVAINLAENKIINITKKSDKLFKQKGIFKTLTFFYWKCYIMNIKNNNFYNMTLNIKFKKYNKFERDIFLILDKALQRIIQHSIKQMNFIIIWNNNYINLVVYINT